MPLAEPAAAPRPPGSNGVGAVMAALPFGRLERTARRLQWMVVTVLVIVMAVPVSTAAIVELHHLRKHAVEHASWISEIVAEGFHRSPPDLDAVAGAIRGQMAAGGVVAVRLLDTGGHEMLRLGDPGSTWFPTTATFSFAATAAPLGRLSVVVSDRALVAHLARVGVIHFFVATLLIVMFRLPMGALRDAISEVKATHAQLIHSDKLSAIGEMYAAFTHEINNPLGIILSRVKLLLTAAKGGGLPVEVVKDLEMIDGQGGRIAGIIRSLLAFARRTTFDTGEVDLNRVVRDAVTLVEHPFVKDGITVRCLLGNDLPGIQGSPDHLGQVVVNLLNNARDAMPHGGAVTVRTARHGRHVVAEIRDTGAGIAPEIQRRIFEPFFTTKGVGKGTGLGLAVSYGIVRAHGGDIEVEGNPGAGALFRVTLPVPAVDR